MHHDHVNQEIPSPSKAIVVGRTGDKRETYEIQSIELPFVEKGNGLIDEFSSRQEKARRVHGFTIDAYRVLSLLRTALKPLLRADHPPTERMIFKLGLRLFKPYMRR